MEKVLVTGGAGYIGSHACKALRAAGFYPVTYDNLSTGRRRFVRWGPLVEGDVWDADKVRHTLITHDISAVLVELAAREVRHLWVEGGPTVAAAFLRAGAVDELVTYLAPAVLGAGPPAVGDVGVGDLLSLLCELPMLSPPACARDDDAYRKGKC